MSTVTIPETQVINHLPKMVQAMFSLRGQIVTIKTLREMKMRKGQEMIMKESKFQCRAGVDYNNISNVIEKREDGRLPSEPQSLPWGEWEVFPYLISHKGEYYFRCTTIKTTMIPIVRFLKNNVEISKDEAIISCLASEFRDNDDRDVFTIKISSILEINGHKVFHH